MRPEDVRHIAEELGVEQTEVVNMNRRMALGGDASLNVSLAEEGGSEWQDWLTDDEPLPDEQMAAAQESQVRHEMLATALKELNERERQVLTERRLVEEPRTLEDLSVVFGVSRERVRQIEVRAFEKLQKAIERIALRRTAPMRMALAASM
jgi:RNA polymerase sigma-32 factor